MECFFQPQKDKTGPKLTDDEPSLSGATKKKATGKEYEKQTNGFTSYVIYTNTESFKKYAPSNQSSCISGSTLCKVCHNPGFF